MNLSFSKTTKITILCLTGVACGVFAYSEIPSLYNNIEYVNQDMQGLANNQLPETQQASAIPGIADSSDTATVVPLVSHVATPDSVKAVYMSSWVAGSVKYRTPIMKLLSETELNAVVIDVKDSTGRISFPVSDPNLASFGSVERRISDIDTLIKELHAMNIYIIGRVAVFQDPYLTKKKPEWSIKRQSDGGVWKDNKGLSFLDPSKKEVWEYVESVGKEAYSRGFDEINFDYIRYPSDGNMKDINYNLAPGQKRADMIENFFIHLSSEMKKDANIPISADLFGFSTELDDDMGIGQVWEKALPHFDFLAPMIYPSHYPSGHAGFKNPAAHPYEVIKRALLGAIEKTKAIGGDIQKIRPWLQDFDLGAVYTSELVRAQIKATYDVGLDSWMMWDPANKYVRGALLEKTP